jgi:hypothetical protein
VCVCVRVRACIHAHTVAVLENLDVRGFSLHDHPFYGTISTDHNGSDRSG